MKNYLYEHFTSKISRLVKAIQTLRSQKMAEYGLKGTTALCLCSIGGCKEGLNAGELSAMLEIDKAQVSRCMAELVEKEFAFRNDCEGRHYRQKYCLTEKGHLVAEDIVKSTEEMKARIRRNLTDEEVDSFYRVLDTLCENLQTP